MGLIFLLPRCCSYGRPSWSVTRTYCSSSEAFGGAAITEAENSGFKPIKKKKKKVAPREVDPSVFDPSNRPNCDLVGSVAAKLASERRFGIRKGPRCSVPPEDVAVQVGPFIRNFCKEKRVTVEDLLLAGNKMVRHFRGRKPPMERAALDKMKAEATKAAEEKLLAGFTDQPSTEALEEVSGLAKKKADKIAHTISSHWKPITYNEAAVLAYLLGKAPYDYATARSVMTALSRENRDFRPRSMLDFGTGVGTALWAAQDVFGQMDEIFAVEPSAPMNDVARTVATKRRMTRLDSGSFFRLRLPADNELKYDLVTCAHTLLELPSAYARVSAIDSLWRRTSVGGYFIITEIGTNAGFQLISEARNYLLQVARVDHGNAQEDAELNGHVALPCPHQNRCPRYHLDTVPCNFDVKYKNFQLLDVLPHVVREAVHSDKFSYVIFKKGAVHQSSSCKYPRLVEQPMIKPSNAICRMCTDRGMLEEVLVRKASNRLLYNYVKGKSCGEKLMVHLSDNFAERDEPSNNESE